MVAVEKPLLAAFRSDNLELVMACLMEDETRVHVPMQTEHGSDPPILVALKEGCSADILQCLLRAGASAHDLDSAGLTALEVLAKARRGEAPGPDLLALSGAGAWAAFRPPDGLLLPSLAAAEAGGGDEDRCCACARLLLARGVAVGAAAEAAEERGCLRLAGLIRHWRELLAVRQLQQLRTRHARPGEPTSGRHATSGSSCGPALLDCPQDVWDLVREALVPGEAALRQHCHADEGP